MTFMTKGKLAIAIVATLLSSIIIFQNTDVVDTKLLMFTVTMSRAILYSLIFAGGVVVGLILAYLLAGGKPKSE